MPLEIALYLVTVLPFPRENLSKYRRCRLNSTLENGKYEEKKLCEKNKDVSLCAFGKKEIFT